MKYTNADHRKAYMKAPREVIQTGKYIYERIHKPEDFPTGTVYRTIKMGSHRVRVGYWGRKIKGKHEAFAVVSVLHPREGKCRFKKRLDRMGVKLLSNRPVTVNGVPPLTGGATKRIISPLRIFR